MVSVTSSELLQVVRSASEKLRACDVAGTSQDLILHRHGNR